MLFCYHISLLFSLSIVVCLSFAFPHPTCYNFLSLYWNGLLYLFCLTLYLLSFPSFAILINLFKLCCKTCLLFLFGLFFTIYPLGFSLLSTYTCYRSIFTYPSSLISHLSFIFLFGFPRETLILSPTSFEPTKISSFSSMLVPVGIFRNYFYLFGFYLDFFPVFFPGG